MHEMGARSKGQATIKQQKSEKEKMTQTNMRWASHHGHLLIHRNNCFVTMVTKPLCAYSHLLLLFYLIPFNTAAFPACINQCFLSELL
eukprot:scaffold12176_cov144-Skeletonema_marinoi.AAC.15